MNSRGNYRATQQLAIAQRQRQVARLYLSGIFQSQIAEQLHVSPQLISADIQSLKERWRRQATADIGEHSARMLARLEDMDSQAALQASSLADPSDKARFMELRLSILRQIAKLMGLEAPERRTSEVTVHSTFEDFMAEKLKPTINVTPISEGVKLVGTGS